MSPEWRQRHAPVGLILRLAGWGVFAAAVAVPTAVLLVRCRDAGPTSDAISLATTRQWGLLARSIALASSAVVTSLMLAVPGAMSVGRGAGRAARWQTALLVTPLLVPPMVMVFGWQKLLGAAWAQAGDVLRYGLCIAVWAGGSWPIPALVLGSAWRRVGRDAFEAALLESSSTRAFLRTVRQTLAGPLVLCAALLFALFCGEYTVPHACGLIVYSTELLGWATTSAGRPLEVVLPSIPLVAVILIGLSVAGWQARRRWTHATQQSAPAERTGLPGWRALALAAVLAVTVVVPLSSLLWQLYWLTRHRSVNIAAPLTLAWQTYGGALLETALVAGSAGVLAIVLGVGVSASRWLAGVTAGVTIAFGVLPGGLIGEAILATYRPVVWIYDSPLLVILAFVARYGWVGVVAAMVAAGSVGRDVVDQARTDGASEGAIVTRVRLANGLRTLAAGAAVVTTLGMTDVATASLVQVPSVRLISLIIIEKFHRFEDDMLISLSLWLVAAAVGSAVLVAAVRRHQRMTKT